MNWIDNPRTKVIFINLNLLTLYNSRNNVKKESIIFIIDNNNTIESIRLISTFENTFSKNERSIFIINKYRVTRVNTHTKRLIQKKKNKKCKCFQLKYLTVFLYLYNQSGRNSSARLLTSITRIKYIDTLLRITRSIYS